MSLQVFAHRSSASASCELLIAALGIVAGPPPSKGTRACRVRVRRLGTRVAVLGDLPGLPELLDNQVLVVFLDQTLDVQPLVTGEEQEAVGVGTDRFVGGERDRDALVAGRVGALADKLDRRGVEFLRELLDSLVHLAEDALVEADAPLALTHARQPSLARPPMRARGEEPVANGTKLWLMATGMATRTGPADRPATSPRSAACASGRAAAPSPSV